MCIFILCCDIFFAQISANHLTTIIWFRHAITQNNMYIIVISSYLDSDWAICVEIRFGRFAKTNFQPFAYRMIVFDIYLHRRIWYLFDVSQFYHSLDLMDKCV